MGMLRHWFYGLGMGVLLAFAAGSGCSRSDSASEAAFIAPSAGGETSKPDDSPVPPGPPASSDELAKMPWVEAGTRQVSDTNVLVSLRGVSRSGDGRLAPAAVLWEQIEGPEVRIADPTALESAIVVPDLDRPTMLRFRLAVWDAEGRANADTTTVLVQPQPVIARVVGAVVNENSEQAIFKIRLSQPKPEAQVLRYRTLEGTARENVHFVPVQGEVEFAAGQREALISVALLNDPETEGYTSFSLEITTPLNEVGVFNSGVMLIVNGDAPTLEQTLSFDLDQSVVLQVGEVTVVPPDTSMAPGTGVLRWASSNLEVATVDGATGQVSAVGTGTTTITAYKEPDHQYLGAAASYQLQVIPVELSPQLVEFELEVDQMLFVGETLTNSLLVLEGGDGEIRYQSSDPQVAQVDEQGTVTALGTGSAIITAVKAGDERYAEASASYELTVEWRRLVLSAEPPQLELTAGGTASVEVVEYLDGEQPRYPNCPPQELIYLDQFTAVSSDSGVVAIASRPIFEGDSCNPQLIITAINPGTAQVTITKAASGGYASAATTIEVTVTPAPLLEQHIVFELDGTLVMQVDETLPVPIADAGPGSGALSYSSSAPEVVSVSAAGELTALAEGDASITVIKAADERYAAAATSFEVAVALLPVNLEFEESQIVVEVGEAGRNVLSFEIDPPEDWNIMYTSTDPDVASVDAEGNFTALTPGTTTISAFKTADERYSAAQAQYELTVTPVEVEVIAEPDMLDMQVGDVDWVGIYEYVDGSFRFAEDCPVDEDYLGLFTLSSSDPEVVRASPSLFLSKGGPWAELEAVGTGTAIVTIHKAAEGIYGPATTTITVRVEAPPLLENDLVFSAEPPQTLYTTETFQNRAVSSVGSRGVISYRSSEDGIATVDADGTITALRPGTVTITATQASDGIYMEAEEFYTIEIESLLI